MISIEVPKGVRRKLRASIGSRTNRKARSKLTSKSAKQRLRKAKSTKSPRARTLLSAKIIEWDQKSRQKKSTRIDESGSEFLG